MGIFHIVCSQNAYFEREPYSGGGIGALFAAVGYVYVGVLPTI